MPSEVYYVKTNDGDSPHSISKKLSILIEKSKVLDFVKGDDFTAIKLHFGEEGNVGHIRKEWAKVVIEHLMRKTKNLFLTDTNVLYKNSRRTNSIDHMKVAYKHGFGYEDVGAPILIADGLFGKDYVDVEIDKKHFSKVRIARDIADCDSMIVLSHATGHMMTGFAGALKNLGMGCASRRGKYEQHSGFVPNVDVNFCTGCGLCVINCPADCIVMVSKRARILKERCIGCGECVVVCRTKAIDTEWDEGLENLQQKMVEYAYGAIRALKGRVAYINFIIHTTKDCDCLAKDEPKIAKDIGVLASYDPVSIDKASADLVNESCGRDIFKKNYPKIDWTVQLEYAHQIGLGDLDYKLKRL